MSDFVNEAVGKALASRGLGSEDVTDDARAELEAMAAPEHEAAFREGRVSTEQASDFVSQMIQNAPLNPSGKIDRESLALSRRQVCEQIYIPWWCRDFHR